MKGKPWNCQVELVRGCNYRCDFCAIQVVPKEPAFMMIDTFINSMIGLSNFDPIRLEFAMRGEPTMHPELISFTYIARSFLEKSQITLTTNGHLLTEVMAQRFFSAGGNIIVVDCYHNTFDKYMERFKKFKVCDFHRGTFNPWHRHGPKEKAIVLVEDIGCTDGKRQRVIINQAGNVDWDKVKKYGLRPLEKPLKKKCVHPFREIAIFYNGNVSICCRDWKEEHIIFNVDRDSIKRQWHQNTEWERVRKELYNKRRENVDICKRCDFHGGFRFGFLPKGYADAE